MIRAAQSLESPVYPACETKVKCKGDWIMLFLMKFMRNERKLSWTESIFRTDRSYARLHIPRRINALIKIWRFEYFKFIIKIISENWNDSYRTSPYDSLNYP